MRLRGKAQEWFQSRPEFVEMPFDVLLVKYRRMFFFRPSKSATLRQLQERTWRTGESFVDYYHDKMIRANRIPIDDPYELIDHLVEGIPDQTLRNQATVYCFINPEAMLRAYEKLVLPQPYQGSNFRGDRWRANPPTRTDGDRWRAGPSPRTKGDRWRSSPPTRMEEQQQGDRRAPRRDVGNCYNCGEMGHPSRSCPVKDRGLRCYRCGQHGHIAPRCTQQGSTGAARNTNLVAQNSEQKTCKSVRINNFRVTALIDTGSDLTLMRDECYSRIGAPGLQIGGITFRGIGSGNIRTRGSFRGDIDVDGGSYPIMAHVVSNALLKYDLLIGADFLSKANVAINKGVVRIGGVEEDQAADSNIPDMCRIECIENVDEIDLSHISNAVLKGKVEQMVASYVPEKTRESNVKMRIIVKDE